MRSHLCADVNATRIDETVTVCGWAHRRRDHGGVVFIDLRDRSGLLQIVADPDRRAAFEIAETVRHEYVLCVTGRVRRRPEGTENPELATGEVEVFAHQIELLSRADPLPFQLDEDDVSETVRGKYRYLDLRRDVMQRSVRLRHHITRQLRGFLESRDFVDIETPILTRSTPEGARDYLVPSRTHPGQFFALPQSPQLFKQILMVAGFERYYQIARCFRDEDLRADRQPEFTQLDIEMSFVKAEDVMSLTEQMVRELFAEVLGAKLPEPFPVMDYADVVSRYGSDRPDLRIPLELVELKSLMRDVEFKVFSGPASRADGRVAALRVSGGGDLSRLAIDKYTDYVKQFGARGLAYVKVNQAARGRDGLQSPILKFLPDDVIGEVLVRTGAQDNDLIFFGADDARVVNESLGALRGALGRDLGLVTAGWHPLWVVNFPMFEYDEARGRFDPLHHPFTAPRVESLADLEADPGAAVSQAYDLVLNGTEIGGGSIRIHDPQVQERVLAVLGIDREEAHARFGFLLEALRYGAPPHGGIAFGLDRLAAMLGGFDSIRDVIAFPKTQRASCLMTDAPSAVSPTQLRELHLRTRAADATAAKN